MFRDENERQRLLEAQVQRGTKAQELLENELLAHVLQKMREERIADLLKVDKGDEHARDAAWRELRALDAFEKKLKTYVNVGSDSRKMLQKLFDKVTKRAGT